MATDTKETLRQSISKTTIEREKAHASYRRLLNMAKKEGPEAIREVMAELDRRDLFYLLVYTCNRVDCDNDWVFARCREIQADPWGNIDIWAREHYKTSINTALTIQTIINDPEGCHSIFAFTRPISKGFLRPIKFEMENNIKLKVLHPEIFWNDPRKESPKWSEDDGLICKREGNPKEATIEAWGLIDGQPTSKHFKYPWYNDIVTIDTVGTPEMIAKGIDRWELSLNLWQAISYPRYEGTFYHYAETYNTIIDRKAARPRIYPATVDGTPTGKPVLWTREVLNQKINDMGGIGSYNVACQLFCQPSMETFREFKLEYLQYWPANNYHSMNIYILCDPANSKKKGSDYTVFIVIGLGHDGNYYVIDIIRDRLNLIERANILFKLHQQYKPICVGYEKYGKDSDIEHFQDRMNRDNYRFPIIPLGGSLAKIDRIRRLIPDFANRRMYLPERCVHTNYEGIPQDIVKIFINTEYRPFPFCEHDDIFDCMSRIKDEELQATFPAGTPAETFGLEKDYADELKNYDPLGRNA